MGPHLGGYRLWAHNHLTYDNLKSFLAKLPNALMSLTCRDRYQQKILDSCNKCYLVFGLENTSLHIRSSIY